MEFDPNTALLAIVTIGAGYLMVVAGLHKSLLEWRRPGRTCPSCGHTIHGRVCSSCSSS